MENGRDFGVHCDSYRHSGRFSSRAQHLTRLESADLNTFNGRTAIWSYSWKCFLDSSAFEIIFGRRLAFTTHFLTPAIPEFENLHNTYLLWLMEQGVVGLLVFASFLLTSGRSVLQSRHPQKAVLCSLAGVAVAGWSVRNCIRRPWILVLLGVLAGAGSFRPEDANYCVELPGVPERSSPLTCSY